MILVSRVGVETNGMGLWGDLTCLMVLPRSTMLMHIGLREMDVLGV